MKSLRLLLLASLLPFATAQADPAAFIGLSYTFSGNAGISAKVLSDDEENNAVVAAGATYYPFAQNKFGLDVSAGYAFDNTAALIGYDFLQHSVQGSVGWADTENENTPIVAPVFVPAPGSVGSADTENENTPIVAPVYGWADTENENTPIVAPVFVPAPG